MAENSRLPKWLKVQRASGQSYNSVKQLIDGNHLHTICTSGNCPNKGECWNAGTATMMILGDICTRSCKFCGTKTGQPLPPDKLEPHRIADTVKLLKLKHCVITSVDRDDLPDGGSQHWYDVITKVKELNPDVTMEVLIPDFRGVTADIDRVIEAGPDVISHNIETVRRLTPKIRSVAKYNVSLDVLKHIASRGVVAKSGIMLGLGETESEVNDTITDIFNTGCKVLTIGQYLAPSRDHMPVVEYINPVKFDEYRAIGLTKGFRFVESSPLVRSSFHAEKHVTGKGGPNSNEVSSDKVLRDSVINELVFTDLGIMDYKQALEFQQEIFNKKVAQKSTRNLSNETIPDNLIFVEHNHVYTLGKSGSESNLLIDYIQLQAKDATFYRTDRGGDITYHGPGQLVGYPIIDLEHIGIGVKEYIYRLEESVIKCLANYGIKGEHYHGATGVWLDTLIPGKTRKICAIGVKVNRSITMHGFALNVNTDLSYFNHINPCGFTDKGVTSIAKETGRAIDMSEVKEVLHKNLNELIGR